MGDHLGGSGDMDMPYEDVPDGPIPNINLNCLVASGVILRAAMAPSPLVPDAMLPILVFDFATGDGDMLPSIALVLEPDQLAAFPQLVEATVEGARKGAGQ